MEFCLFVLFCFPPNPFCYCAGSSLVLKSIHTCSTEFKNNIRSKTCRSCSQFFSICRSVVELIIPRHYHIIVMDYQYYLSVLLPCKSQNICYMRWTGGCRIANHPPPLSSIQLIDQFDNNSHARIYKQK